MYRFKLYNSSKCLNYINKSFNICYQHGNNNNNIIIKHRDYNSIYKNKKCLKNDIPLCCVTDTSINYIPTGNLPFIIKFKYTDAINFFDPTEFYNDAIPIFNGDNGFKNLSIVLEPSFPKYNTDVTLYIYWDFKDNISETIQSGVTFNKTVTRDWWNNKASNIDITQWGGIPLSRANTSLSPIVISDGQQFYNLNSFEKISATDTPSILTNTKFNYIFSSSGFFNGYLSNWNTYNVIDMNNAFSFATEFNNGDNGDNRSKPLTWNTSNVTNFSGMFRFCIKFNQSVSYDPINNYWNTSQITNNINMQFMFNDAVIFNNGDISGGNSKKMNWIINFVGTPFQFSAGSLLTLAPGGNSPFTTSG